MARARVRASDLIGRVHSKFKKVRGQKSDVESLYFHHVFGAFRCPDMIRKSVEAERTSFLRDAEDDDNNVLSTDDVDALRANERVEVDFDAYCDGIVHLLDSATSKEVFRYLFQVYDEDMDGRLTRTELYDLLRENTRIDAIVPRTKSSVIVESERQRSERAQTRLYTWLKKYFPRYSSCEDAEDAEDKTAPTIDLPRACALLVREMCVDCVVMNAIELHLSTTTKRMHDRDMEEFREEAKDIFGKKAMEAADVFGGALDS